MTAQPQPLTYPIDYPITDGRPIAESDRHRQELTDLIAMLAERYRSDPNVYVTGNMFFYYLEGNPQRFFAPDVAVVFGVPKREREVYRLWEEGRAPDVVFELSSRSTWREDVVDKKALCARLGVREYFLYDPRYECLKPPLQGSRLAGDAYEPIIEEAEGALHSEVLGLTLHLEQGRIQLVDTASGERLIRPEERDARRWQAETRATAEAEARQKAEAEVARLRDELARLQRKDAG
jgi:Uma2 family endonuclease